MKATYYFMKTFCFLLFVILMPSCTSQNQQPKIEESISTANLQESQPVAKYSFRIRSTWSPTAFSLDNLPSLEPLRVKLFPYRVDGDNLDDGSIDLCYCGIKVIHDEQEALAKRRELWKSRFTEENKPVSNKQLLTIAHAQYTHGFFNDAMLTFQMVKPNDLLPELQKKIQERGYHRFYYEGDNSDHYGKILQSDIYLKDRLLRHLARTRFTHQDSLGAVQAARMIYSEPERNDALLEIIRVQCYGAFMGKKSQFDEMIEKTFTTQSHLSGPAKDYGLGTIAYAYLYKGNTAKALELIDQIQSDTCRDEALEWQFGIMWSHKWFHEDSQFKEELKNRVTDPFVLCRMMLGQFERHRLTIYRENEELLLKELGNIRSLAMKQPRSQEKYDTLDSIAVAYLPYDSAQTRKILLAVFDEIKTLDAADPLLISNALAILRTNKYRMTSWRDVGDGIPSSPTSLPREKVLEISHLILEKTREKYSQPIQTANGHRLLDGRYAITIDRATTWELPQILIDLVDYNIPEAGEVVFALIDRNALDFCHRELSRCFMRRGFQEQQFKNMLDRLSPQTQGHFLAAFYEYYKHDVDFPAEAYLTWLEGRPEALRIIQQMYLDNRDYLQHEKILYESAYNRSSNPLREMLAKLDEMQ